MACETMCTFLRFFTFFFQNPKKHDFLRFFELLHSFSRTVLFPVSALPLNPGQRSLKVVPYDRFGTVSY